MFIESFFFKVDRKWLFECDVISGNGTNLNGEGGEGEAGPLVDDDDLGPML